MNKKTTIWLIIAVSMILAGCIVFCGVMASLDFDFNKLSTVQYETNEYIFADVFSSICIKTDTADIEFIPASNGECSVVCFEETKVSHSVSVKDGSLVIEIQNEKEWYDYIGINTTDNSKITVSLPQTQYRALLIEGDTSDVDIPKDLSFETMDISLSTGDVTSYASVAEDAKIAVTTGDVVLDSITAKNLQLSVTTGKTELSNLSCNALISTGNTGDIILKNVVAAESFSIERNTGDVSFEHCDAGDICVITDTGDITGSLLREKIFIAQSDTGNVSVPKTTAGGKCELTTDTGSIKITIE